MKHNPFNKYLGKEDKLQHEVMNYIKLQYPKVLAIHVPNEGKRTPFERYKFKVLGGVAGVPDVMIFASNGDYSGLAIELKVGKNRPTKNQLDCIDLLNKAGWYATWVNSFGKAKKTIDQYFDNGL